MTLGYLIPNTLGSENEIQCFRKVYAVEEKNPAIICRSENFKKGNTPPPSKCTQEDQL